MKFPAFYGTRRFITAFTTARHLFSPEPVRLSPCPLSHFSKIHFNIILPSTPESSVWFLPSGFPTKSAYALIFSPICPAHIDRMGRYDLDINGQDSSRSGFQSLYPTTRIRNSCQITNIKALLCLNKTGEKITALKLDKLGKRDISIRFHSMLKRLS